MKKKPLRLALAAILVIVTLAAYFEPTHCVRGWLYGEAFFDGRPTSYWRGRIDRWLEKHDSPQLAAQLLLATPTGVVEFDLSKIT